MVLATTSGRVFQSTDGGNHWSEVVKPPLSSITSITYNPYRPTEVWLVSYVVPWTPGSGGIYKSTDAAFTSWQNVTPADGNTSWTVEFTGESSVYINRRYSTDGGLSWQPFGPLTAGNEISFIPGSSQIGYIPDSTYGVQKTTDGGQTWQVKNQGLAAMSCNSMVVSLTNPLQVFGAFGGWPGIYRSDDGTSSWTYLPIAGSGNVPQVCQDPFDPQRLYAAASSGLYVSTDEGGSWSDLGWNTTSTSAPGGPANVMAADPHHPGHLLVALPNNAGTTVALYASSDYGVSWQPLTLPQVLVGPTVISNIVFDPETPGLVYLTTKGLGIYRSTDSGTSWQRIDDSRQPELATVDDTGRVAIATHPRPVLFVGAEPDPFRSFDGGATWEQANDPGGVECLMFVGGDSTRLYAGTAIGLFFSNDAGDTWTRAAVVLGRLRITALGYAAATDHAIIYAATTGGDVRPMTSSTAGKKFGASRAAAKRFVGGGIYRYVQLPVPKLTLKLSGLTSGALRLGRRMMAAGNVTPTRLAGGKVTFTLQKKARKWLTVKTVMRTLSARGAYSWKYKPAKRGSYRLQATIGKAVTHTAAKTTWRGFKVK